jgi:hypothetical protein
VCVCVCVYGGGHFGYVCEMLQDVRRFKFSNSYFATGIFFFVCVKAVALACVGVAFHHYLTTQNRYLTTQRGDV